MRPLSFIVLGCAVITIGAMLFGGLGALSPVISVIVLVVSALLILVDFNYIRKHATEDDVVWLATGIFVSIINIFTVLLNSDVRSVEVARRRDARRTSRIGRASSSSRRVTARDPVDGAGEVEFALDRPDVVVAVRRQDLRRVADRDPADRDG